MNTKTAEVHTFVRKTPSVGIMFLASMLATRTHDKVCLSHLEDGPVKTTSELSFRNAVSKPEPITVRSEELSPALPEGLPEAIKADLQTMAEPETAPIVEAAPVETATVRVTKDFKEVWDLETAKEAFAALEASGLSKTAFAKANGFGVDRFKRWADRV